MPGSTRTRPLSATEEVIDVDTPPLSRDLVDQMLELEREIKRGNDIVSAALWSEGDLVAYKYALNDKQLGELAQAIGVKKDILAERRRIAQVFPEGDRNPEVPWSVHQALARLAEEEDEPKRRELLFEDRERPWTVDEVRFEVKNYLDGKKGEDDDDPTSRQEFRGGMSVGGIKVTGRRRGGRLEIVVYADPVTTPNVNVLEGDSVTVIFKVDPDQ